MNNRIKLLTVLFSLALPIHAHANCDEAQVMCFASFGEHGDKSSREQCEAYSCTNNSGVSTGWEYSNGLKVTLATSSEGKTTVIANERPATEVQHKVPKGDMTCVASYAMGGVFCALDLPK
ncbi:hypothetical protein IOC51_09830 [Vibrio parahaemolyticus]|uniref:hypothetical protein n=1 Tax=Vibrio parahaemolyticus TaxID=670 RepID=UPI001E2B2479|nr:hypothetical protein [Vibrio parahaemolyticus]MCD1414339.1 hypothetical protein [Vibrio parahaemolyticus]